MKKFIKLAFTAGIGLMMLGSCAKTVNGTWARYEERGCKPTWVSYNSDNRSRKNLEALLKADGIIPLKIRISGERNLNCNTCFCETGKVYRVKVDESQLGLMFYYGFESD
ncbi:MAG: hypothetical protein MK078_07545 [Crocinitomicaceae bacterium]|nr:hypothetical protein [Crocinitomicaceae bacterium]